MVALLLTTEKLCRKPPFLQVPQTGSLLTDAEQNAKRCRAKRGENVNYRRVERRQKQMLRERTQTDTNSSAERLQEQAGLQRAALRAARTALFLLI